MTRAETYGHRFSLAVREYLDANKLDRLGQINSRILAEIAQGFHDNEKKVVKRAVKEAGEEAWLKELEADPAMQGIDVRRELGRCQFHFKGQGIVVSRARFKRWLLRAERDSNVSRSYDGATSKPAKPQAPKPRYTLETPVPGWPMVLRNYTDVPSGELEWLSNLDWSQLPVGVREKIIQAA